KPGYRGTTDGGGLRAEELLAGFEASEVQQGKSGYRRHDGRGVVRTLAGALASHPGTTAQRDLQAAAGEAGRDSETGRRDASAGHPDGAGPHGAAGGDAGFAAQMGLGVLRTQSRVPARAFGASGGRQGPTVRGRGTPLGGGSRSGEVFRSGQPRQADGGGSATGRRQEGAKAGAGVPHGGRDGEWAGGYGGGGHAARWATIATTVEPGARRTGSRAGTAQTLLRAVCGRLQHLRRQPTGRRAGEAEYHGLHHTTTQAQGQRAEECGSAVGRR